MKLKYILVILLCLGFIGALISLVRIARNKKSSTLQLLALSLDIAYFPSAVVIIARGHIEGCSLWFRKKILKNSESFRIAEGLYGDREFNQIYYKIRDDKVIIIAIFVYFTLPIQNKVTSDLLSIFISTFLGREKTIWIPVMYANNLSLRIYGCWHTLGMGHDKLGDCYVYSPI